MGVPAVVPGCFTTVGHLQRPYLADVPHLLENLLDLAVTEEGLQGLSLLVQQLGQNVAALMGGGQGEKEDRAALGLVQLHGVQQLDAPPFRDLGRADRASPDAPAGLQTAIAGRAVLLGFPDLNVTVMRPDSEAFSRAAFGED